MNATYRPEGFHTVTPYLMVSGIKHTLSFLEEAFGAQVTEKIDHGDDTIVHAQVRIGDSMVMLGEPKDASEAMPAALYLYVEDVDRAYDSALKAGSKSIMEPQDMFYGDRNAGIIDRAGNQWWIARQLEEVKGEELARRAAEAKDH